MFSLLHIDGSARPGCSGEVPHGSHTRRLGARFVARWRQRRPGDRIVHRDLGLTPPAHVDGRWIHAAFTPPAQRVPWMSERLAESDGLIDELLDSALVVMGVPMYNFGMPAPVKAWIDNVVRVGRTFGFDRSRAGAPYWPMLADQDRHAVLLGARGDHDYDPGGRNADDNLVERGVMTPLRYMGITAFDRVAVEYDEFADARLAASIARAEAAVDVLVDRLADEADVRERAAPATPA
jgi:FMN-dependent NADH-azoreductase